jgi:hypothetical protein
VYVVELIRRDGTEVLATWPEAEEARELCDYYRRHYAGEEDVIAVRVRRLDQRTA